MNAKITPTQCERLLTYLKDTPINPMEAWQTLGIYRLASRINDLRKAGHNIETRRIKVSNRYGETTEVAEYHLKAGNGRLF